MKDLTSQDELEKQIPKTAREFRFGDMIFKITKSKNDTYGFVIKNTENPKFHHTLVAKDEPEMHYTKESDGIAPNQRQDIDFEQFGKNLANMVNDVFSNAKIIPLDDPRFVGKTVVMIMGQRMIVESSTSKKVNFDQEIEYKESLFQDIDLSENRMGVIYDGDDELLIFVNNGRIFHIDFDSLDSQETEMNQIIMPNFE
ncbi:MAG: hypothetical protein J4F36_09440 [Nitrosopumilaceae archaeon]|nr:hypothetical protein [Nitrosopumilaceae archaeon]